MKRMASECRYDYCARRLAAQEAAKRAGFIHVSHVMVNKGTVSKPLWEKVKVQGTYVKPKEQRKLKVRDLVKFGSEQDLGIIYKMNPKKRKAWVIDLSNNRYILPFKSLTFVSE